MRHCLPSFLSLLIFLHPDSGLFAATPGRLENVSSRVSVSAGDGAIISGFIIKGAAQTVVVRALGPSLTRYGIAGALPDPTLEIHNASGGVVATNDNWQDGQATLFSRNGIYRAYQPPSTQEPVIAITLQPGAYTAVVSGKNGGTGVALAEVYAVTESTSGAVSNISTRAMVRTADDVLIGGLTVGGDTNVSVVLRATGPSLSRFGVTNVLVNPILELHDGDGTLIGYNDNWRDDADQAARITRAGYAPASLLEPAMSVTLAPGNYTAVVRGNANTTGVALFEAYQVTSAQSSTAPPAPTPAMTPPSTAPAIPHGVFSLTQAGKNINPAALANINVDGISLRQAWSDLQPSAGIYNWSYLDSQIARASAAGKAVTLRIGTGADNIPAWAMSAVRAAGGSTFTFTDSLGRHTIPVFWDPTFVAQRKAMINAVGARYSGNPTLKVFTTNFANAISEDWAVPHNNTVDPGYAISEVLRWQNAGYDSQKLIEAGKAMIDASMSAFPNQLVAIPINSNGNALDYPNNDNYVSQTVINNARGLWGAGRLIVMKNSLSAKIPSVPPTTGSWGVWSNSRPAVAAQALWFSYGDTTYRNNGGTPCAAMVSLQRLVDLGATYGAGYVELYEMDVVNLPSVIAHAHSVL